MASWRQTWRSALRSAVIVQQEATQDGSPETGNQLAEKSMKNKKKIIGFFFLSSSCFIGSTRSIVGLWSNRSTSFLSVVRIDWRWLRLAAHKQTVSLLAILAMKAPRRLPRGSSSFLITTLGSLIAGSRLAPIKRLGKKNWAPSNYLA